MRIDYQLTVKAADATPDGLRIRGIASTSQPDGLGDILDSEGAEFSLPMPILWQHKRGQVVGRLEAATVGRGQITFDGFLPYVQEAGILKDRVDEAIHSVKYGLVRTVSVGFKEIPSQIERLKSGGLRFKKWLWRELSLVDIAENGGAVITHMRAWRENTDPELPPAVAGTTDARRSGQSNGAIGLNINETIVSLKATQTKHAARMTELLTKAADEGRATEPVEQEEFDRLNLESSKIDEDIKRYSDLEAVNLKAATPLQTRTAADFDRGTGDTNVGARDPFAGRISTRRNLAKGAAFTRYTMALLAAKGNTMQALEIARSRYRDTPEVIDVMKAAVEAGTTTDATWAGPLVQYQDMAAEFIELLRPRTIVGQIAGLRRVPFNIRVGRQTAGGTYGWVGQAKPKPVGELAFDSATMDFAKIAGIIVITEELARFSSPDAEATVRADMLAGVAQYLDQQFIDPSVGAVANVSPASITNGAPTVAASGTDEANILHDIRSLWALMPANLSRRGGVFVTDENTAIGLSMMRNSLSGVRSFDGVTPEGGTLLGYPLIVSNTVPNDTNEGLLVFMVPSEILFAEDTIVIDASREASLQMNSTPDSPVTASTVMVSLWQHNMIGLKVEKFVNYQRRRDDVVAYITGTAYGTSES